MGRLFYHTALILLAQIHPVTSVQHSDMQALQLANAHQICGIVAHMKDRGVVSAAIRCTAIAAEVLVDRYEQEEVLQILDKTQKDTGWKIDFISRHLKSKWGWTTHSLTSPSTFSGVPDGSNSNQHNMFAAPSGPVFNNSLAMPVQSQPQVQSEPKGMRDILNPWHSGDFNLPKHPYKGDYVPPTHRVARNGWAS